MLNSVLYDRFIELLKRAWKPRIDEVELSKQFSGLFVMNAVDQYTSLTVLVSLKVSFTN